MGNPNVEDTGGAELALVAAQHYRSLRVQGVTVRRGVDVLIAAYCIEKDYAPLHHDSDFTAFETYRGLRGWHC